AQEALRAVPRHGRARDRDRRDRHREVRRRRPGGHRHRCRSGRQSDDPQRRGRSPALTAPRMGPMLSERQELILELVVDAYLASGRPVPSKEIAELPEVEWGSSTVRAELAALEAAGYLTHPHTSAGRVPTERGYRQHVDSMMAEGGPPAEKGVELELRREIDEAMRETTAALAQETNLMALVTAPSESL